MITTASYIYSRIVDGPAGTPELTYHTIHKFNAFMQALISFLSGYNLFCFHFLPFNVLVSINFLSIIIIDENTKKVKGKISFCSFFFANFFQGGNLPTLIIYTQSPFFGFAGCDIRGENCK